MDYNKPKWEKGDGDALDFMLWQTAQAAKNNVPSVIFDYPETVQNALTQFVKVWGIPDAAIPSKRNKSQFKEWIIELTEMENLCGGNCEKAITASLKHYNEAGKDFAVVRPRALKTLLVEVAALRNRNMVAKKKFSDMVIPGEEPAASSEDQISVARNLKNLFKE